MKSGRGEGGSIVSEEKEEVEDADRDRFRFNGDKKDVMGAIAGEVDGSSDSEPSQVERVDRSIICISSSDRSPGTEDLMSDVPVVVARMNSGCSHTGRVPPPS
jgi:hypothetical protein